MQKNELRGLQVLAFLLHSRVCGRLLLALQCHLDVLVCLAAIESVERPLTVDPGTTSSPQQQSMFPVWFTHGSEPVSSTVVTKKPTSSSRITTSLE